MKNQKIQIQIFIPFLAQNYLASSTSFNKLSYSSGKSFKIANPFPILYKAKHPNTIRPYPNFNIYQELKGMCNFKSIFI